MSKSEIKGIIIIAISVIVITALNIRANEINRIKIEIEDKDEYQEYVDEIYKKLGIDKSWEMRLDSLADNTFVVLSRKDERYLIIKYKEENYSRFIKKVCDVSYEYEKEIDNNVLRINFNTVYKTGTVGCFPDVSRRIFAIKLDQNIDTVYAVNNTKETETEIERFAGGVLYDYDNDKEGLMDSNLHILLSPVYHNIELMEPTGNKVCYIVEDDNVKGVVDNKGEWIRKKEK